MTEESLRAWGKLFGLSMLPDEPIAVIEKRIMDALKPVDPPTINFWSEIHPDYPDYLKGLE